MPWINLPVPTVKVKHKDGMDMIINKADFDESVHTLLEDASNPAPVEPEAVEDKPKEEDKLKVKRRVKKPANNND